VERGSSPISRFTLDGIVDEAGKLGPDNALPEVGVNRHRYGDGDGGTGKTGRDNGLQGDAWLDKEVNELSSEYKCEFSAEYNASENKEVDS
jgi:hypothetical protein